MARVHNITGDRERLAQEMDRRRKELGRGWTDVARSFDVARGNGRVITTTESLAKVRLRDGGIADKTFTAIDDGLDWQRGSAEALYKEGRSPVPVEIVGNVGVSPEDDSVHLAPDDRDLRQMTLTDLFDIRDRVMAEIDRRARQAEMLMTL